MSKTIEYIEKEINRLEVAINVHYEDLYQEVNSYSDDYPEKKEILLQINEEVKESKNKLQTLEQIKCELEAWEVCKNKLNLKVQTEEAVTEGFCMKGYWLFVEQYPYTQTTIIEQEEYEILKKALEKYNEN